MDNRFKECRDACVGNGLYISCFRDCLDKPTYDLVAKWYGKSAAEKCYGYSQQVVNAAYNFDKTFIEKAKAEGKSKEYPDYLKAGTVTSLGPPRNSVEEYYLMPVAPYPPGPDKRPGGITNDKPDLVGLKNFIKTNECYKMQLIAQACERQPDRCPLKKPVSGLESSDVANRLLWFGLGATALYLIFKK